MYDIRQVTRYVLVRNENSNQADLAEFKRRDEAQFVLDTLNYQDAYKRPTPLGLKTEAARALERSIIMTGLKPKKGAKGDAGYVYNALQRADTTSQEWAKAYVAKQVADGHHLFMSEDFDSAWDAGVAAAKARDAAAELNEDWKAYYSTEGERGF